MIEKICAELEEASFLADETFDEDGYSNDDGIEVVNLETAKEIVQEMAKEYDWIPVEEKNPTLFESVYVTCISLVDERPPWVIEGIYGTEGWNGMSYMLRWGEAKVIAWMPKELPAPYQKGE